MYILKIQIMGFHNTKFFYFWKSDSYVQYYALINRARGPYEEIFVLTFKAYGRNAVSQNIYFPSGPKSRLIRALLYTYPNKTV